MSSQTKGIAKLSALVTLLSLFLYLNQPSAMTKNPGIILAVGDSLTAGFGVDLNSSYPSLLEQELISKQLNYKVVNSGVSGETSSGTLSRISWLLQMRPNIVILETGANDGLRGLPPLHVKDNIQQIIEELHKEKVIVILTGMKMVWNMGEDYTKEFNKIYPEIAKTNKVLFMPFFLKDVATNPTLNLADTIHPNEEGYAIITKNILPYVLKAIEQDQRER